MAAVNNPQESASSNAPPTRDGERQFHTLSFQTPPADNGVPDQTATNESPERNLYRQDYVRLSRWVRRLGWTTLGVLGIAGALLEIIWFIDGKLVELVWSFWGLLLLGLISGSLTAYSWYRAAKARDLFEESPAHPPAVSFVSVPKGIVDQPSEKDTLGFRVIADAVGKLLRNPATQSPYSLVLSASWGAGKSSVMAQIRTQLCSSGASGAPPFRDLWFNVWHFHSEQHLLTSFLSSILAQCEQLPGFTRRLWWQRFKSQTFGQAYATTLVLALLVPLIGLAGHVFLWHPLITLFPGRAEPSLLTAGRLPLGGSSQFTLGALGALMVAWITGIWTLLRAWRERHNVLSGVVPLAGQQFEAARADSGFRRKCNRSIEWTRSVGTNCRRAAHPAAGAPAAAQTTARPVLPAPTSAAGRLLALEAPPLDHLGAVAAAATARPLAY